MFVFKKKFFCGIMLKKKGLCFSALAALLAPAIACLFVAGCEMSSSPEGRGVITYTVTADGERDALNSTKIDFEFSEAVAGLDEGAVNIIVDTGNVERGVWTGGETRWSLGIVVKTPGDVKVKISSEGIEGAEKTVAVYGEPGLETVAAPEAYPPGQTFQESVSVALETATEGAAIYYTLDNSVPVEEESASNFAYAGPIALDTHSILKARAFKEGLGPSDVLRETYTKAGAVFQTVAAPRAVPEAPLTFYTDTLTISLSCETEGASIYYTLDGAEASRAGALYTGPFAIGEGAAYGKITLKAIAVKDFTNDSEALAAAYVKGDPSLSYAQAPVFSLPAGGIDPGGRVSLSSATEGAAIYYTLDESTPTAEDGTLYAGPLAITERTVIKAIAVKAGMNDSEAAESKYLPKITAGGISWLDITAELPAEVPYSGGKIAWNGTRYVYVPSLSDTPSAYSADLLHWTAGGIVFASGGTPYVAWGNERFVAASGHSGMNVSCSPDGVTWTELVTGIEELVAGSPGSAHFKALIWGGPAGQEVFVAGTSERGGASGDIYWSSDGTAWTRAAGGINTISVSPVQKLIWTGENFAAITARKIVYSPDGKEWRTSSKIFTTEDGGFTAIAYTGTEYIVVTWERSGQNTSVYKLWSSRDLETWTEETVFPKQEAGTRYSFVGYKDGRIYIYEDLHTGPDKLVYSTDKTTWTVAPIEFPIIAYGILYMLNGKEIIPYDGKLFVQE
jgi:hypothetical protein